MSFRYFSHGDEDSSEHSEFEDNMPHITEEEEKALAEECERQGELEEDEDQKQDKGARKGSKEENKNMS